MKSFAGVLQAGGSPPDERLLRHLGATLRLPGSSEPVLQIDQRCGIVTVAHREGGNDVDRITNGEFSFATWDAAAGELFAARDRFGARPFFYARTDRALVFSDSLEAVLAHPDVRADVLDDGAVADYLGSGVLLDAEATMFAGVRRLPPAHTLRSRDGTVTIARYWTPPPQRPRARRDAVAHLEWALKEAIRERVSGPAAIVFMSGGLDSPALAALAREVAPGTHLLAATSVYRTRIADVEELFAAEAARSIGIPHRTFELDRYQPLDSLDAGLWTADPGALLTAAMTRDIYAASAEHAPVALHGHPADAVLHADLVAHLDALPWPSRVAKLVRYTVHRRRPPYFFFRARRESPAAHPLFSPIWSSYFEWAHPLLTRAPIELVYPWCDPRVVEAAMELEPIPWLIDKRVLRELLRGRVSERIRGRHKSFLGSDPWRMPLPPDERLAIDAASRYVDPEQFRATCRADGYLSDRTLRSVAFEYWLRELPRAVLRLRLPAAAPCA